MDELSPQEEKFPKLIDPSASFGAFIGKLGDVLIKAVDKPLGQAVKLGKDVFVLASSPRDWVLQCRAWCSIESSL
jgi:hypothetical protein